MQAFPYNTWKDEFPIANDLGLNCIEWIFELENIESNPICTDESALELIKLSKKYNVKINSVIADNFMKEPLYGEPSSKVSESLNRLIFLIERASTIGIPIIDIPLMGKTSIRDNKRRQLLIYNIKDILEFAKEKQVMISFELDLPPTIILSFMKELNNSNVGINYDMGNSTMLGFDPENGIKTLGEYIVNVHIKDGIKGGGTVPLGEGDTDFETVFRLLNNLNYEGDYILEAARQNLPNNPDPKSAYDTVYEYITFVKKWI